MSGCSSVSLFIRRKEDKERLFSFFSSLVVLFYISLLIGMLLRSDEKKENDAHV